VAFAQHGCSGGGNNTEAAVAPTVNHDQPSMVVQAHQRQNKILVRQRGTEMDASLVVCLKHMPKR
jgi:hypothetical protein